VFEAELHVLLCLNVVGESLRTKLTRVPVKISAPLTKVIIFSVAIGSDAVSSAYIHVLNK